METRPQKFSTENFVKDIRQKTRRLFTSEQKALIVMDAIRGESPVAFSYFPTFKSKNGILRIGKQ